MVFAIKNKLCTVITVLIALSCVQQTVMCINLVRNCVEQWHSIAEFSIELGVNSPEVEFLSAALQFKVFYCSAVCLGLCCCVIILGFCFAPENWLRARTVKNP
jgi:hypothetical protein